MKSNKYKVFDKSWYCAIHPTLKAVNAKILIIMGPIRWFVTVCKGSYVRSRTHCLK